MLAFSLLRYWWVRPQVPDPLQEIHDPLKRTTLTSFLEPPSGPQLSRTELWSKIPHFYGGKNPKLRSISEIENDIAEGKDMILVEPGIAGQIYLHYVSHGWLLQENTTFYGLFGLWFSYFHPKLWFIYTTFSIFSLMHSWVYFRVYKYDRISEYQAYDDDRHPISNLITAWVLGQRPDHYQFVLKKERIIGWEILATATMCSSVSLTLYRLMEIEDWIVGCRFVTSIGTPTTLAEALFTPVSSSGYFHPIELTSIAPGSFLPSDIPNVQGWFDLPWFKLHFKPIKLDIAIIVCTMGGYFAYKILNTLFNSKQETDELGREWSAINPTQGDSDCDTKSLSKYWVEMEDTEAVASKTSPAEPKTVEAEQTEITRIANLIPYGWVRPGYGENHYGVYT